MKQRSGNPFVWCCKSWKIHFHFLPTVFNTVESSFRIRPKYSNRFTLFLNFILSRFHFIPCKDPPKIFKRLHFIFQLRLKFSYYLHSNRAVRGLGGLEQPQRHLRIKFVENFHNLKHYHFVKLAKWVGDRESSLKTNMNFDPSIKLICETAKYFNRSKHHQQLLSDFVLEIRIDKLMTKMCFVIKISNIFTISKKSAQKWTISWHEMVH